MRTIVVTGGAGFIGSNFVYYLLRQAPSWRLVVFDKLTYAGNKRSLRKALRTGRVVFVKGDIAEARQVFFLYRRFRPTYLFNFAAETHVDRSIEGAGAFVRTNVEGTYQLLEGARKFWAGNLGRFSSHYGTRSYSSNSPSIRKFYTLTWSNGADIARSFFMKDSAALSEGRRSAVQAQ